MSGATVATDQSFKSGQVLELPLWQSDQPLQRCSTDESITLQAWKLQRRKRVPHRRSHRAAGRGDHTRLTTKQVHVCFTGGSGMGVVLRSHPQGNSGGGRRRSSEAAN